MTDKNQASTSPAATPAGKQAGNTDAARRRMLLRGGAVAGGLAAFAAGYGETVAKGAKGLINGITCGAGMPYRQLAHARIPH